MAKWEHRLSRLRELFVARCVPRNLHLKPAGVSTAEAPPAGVTYRRVYEKYRNTLEVSEALYADLLDYAKPDPRSVEIDYFVAEIPHGRIFAPNTASVAVISQDNRLLGDLSFNYRKTRVVPAERNNVFKQLNFPPPAPIDGTVFSLLTGGGGAGNYAHWLIDSVARLHLLQASGLFEEVDRFLVPPMRFDFQKDSLRFLGVGEERIVESKLGGHYSADRLLASTAPRGDSVIIPEWVTGFFRDALAGGVELPSFDAPRIYVRRSDSGIRNVVNEDELVAHLAEKGFKSFELSRLSFIEKVGLFAGAEVVVSVHGAGLANVMFCPGGAHFVELFPDQFVLTTYADLAANVGLGYSYLLCPSSAAAGDAKAGQEVHVKVDPEALDLLLEPVINKVHS